MATHRPLEVTLISARDLKNVNFLFKFQVYAVATLSGDPRTRHRTQTDRDGRRNPTWNCILRFSVPASADLILDIALRARRPLLGDRLVGTVRVPLRDLELDAAHPRFVSYQVVRPSGKGKGVLTFSYRFGEPVSVPRPAESVTAYPYPAYPPAAYPQGYAYPPAYPPGYGYAAAPSAGPPGGSKLGLGLGAGLLGGALGGILLGDMVSDAAAYEAAYDAGYDAGYGDSAGGFGDGGFDDGGLGF